MKLLRVCTFYHKLLAQTNIYKFILNIKMLVNKYGNGDFLMKAIRTPKLKN